VFALLVGAGPAFAQFEGVLEMKMTVVGKGGVGGGGGTMFVAVAKAGTRSEMEMQVGPTDVKVVMLQKNDTPDKIFRINDADKTYTEIDLAKMRETAGQQQDAPECTVEKLGQETILGYQTQHVLVKEKNPAKGTSMNMELWAAKDLLDYETFSKLQDHPRRARDKALLGALRAAGADGMPLKAITTGSDGSKATIEVVKADKKSLPASTFEIPAGYTRSAGGMLDNPGGAAGSQAEEAKKKMDEALKNLTPEQRQMMEKMMKERKTGGQ
jgi:hypothetical protein